MLVRQFHREDIMPGPIPNRHKSLCMTPGGRLNLWARSFNASLYLPSDEKEILQRMFNRTFRYGNRVEEISESDFLRGVIRRGQLICPPVDMSATRLADGIERLCARKAARVTVVQGYRYYEPAIDWPENDIDAIPLQPWDTDVDQLRRLVEE